MKIKTKNGLKEITKAQLLGLVESKKLGRDAELITCDEGKTFQTVTSIFSGKNQKKTRDKEKDVITDKPIKRPLQMTIKGIFLWILIVISVMGCLFLLFAGSNRRFPESISLFACAAYALGVAVVSLIDTLRIFSNRSIPYRFNWVLLALLFLSVILLPVAAGEPEPLIIAIPLFLFGLLHFLLSLGKSYGNYIQSVIRKRELEGLPTHQRSIVRIFIGVVAVSACIASAIMMPTFDVWKKEAEEKRWAEIERQREEREHKEREESKQNIIKVIKLYNVDPDLAVETYLSDMSLKGSEVSQIVADLDNDQIATYAALKKHIEKKELEKIQEKHKAFLSGIILNGKRTPQQAAESMAIYFVGNNAAEEEIAKILDTLPENERAVYAQVHSISIPIYRKLRDEKTARIRARMDAHTNRDQSTSTSREKTNERTQTRFNSDSVTGRVQTESDGTITSTIEGEGFSGQSEIRKDGSSRGSYEVNGQKVEVESDPNTGKVTINGKEYDVPKR